MLTLLTLSQIIRVSLDVFCFMSDVRVCLRFYCNTDGEIFCKYLFCVFKWLIVFLLITISRHLVDEQVLEIDFWIHDGSVIDYKDIASIAVGSNHYNEPEFSVEETFWWNHSMVVEHLLSLLAITYPIKYLPFSNRKSDANTYKYTFAANEIVAKVYMCRGKKNLILFGYVVYRNIFSRCSSRTK